MKNHRLSGLLAALLLVIYLSACSLSLDLGVRPPAVPPQPHGQGAAPAPNNPAPDLHQPLQPR
ncbi:MAG: hypothetical protein GC204_17870 [Chloroflexi bacterium]|nr:hypothetical protein [Chloroflexota bacterium]